MGCRILAVFGFLLGLVFLYASFEQDQRCWTVVSLIITGICVIPWVNWVIKQQREQEVQQLQEQVLQTPLPQPEQPQEQPRKRQWILDE